jgi:hypothetical protein
VRTLRTSEAAAYLNVSPNTLRAWEQRFGYPRPRRSAGGHRSYVFAEIAALREALADGLVVASAVSAAREAVTADAHSLRAALMGFDYARADGELERGLALRTLEHTVMNVMVPALREIDREHGYGSAPWAFASRWAEEWLARAERLAGPANPAAHVLFVDCSCNRLDLEALYGRILELFCARAGVTALRLPVRASRCLGHAATAFPARLVVLMGRTATEREAQVFARFAASLDGGVPCVQFRRNRFADDAHEQLAASPLAARRQILKRLNGRA